MSGGDFDESKHPRGDAGKFATGSGGSSGAHADPATRTKTAAATVAQRAVKSPAAVNAPPRDPAFEKASAERRKLIAETPRTADGQFHPDVQKAIRDQTVAEIAQFGLHPNKEATAGTMRDVVRVVSDDKMAGAAGSIDKGSGRITIGENWANHVQKAYATDPHELATKLDSVRHPTLYDDGRPVFALSVLTHEQIHATGPQLMYFKHGIATEEVSTEMCARHVMASTLGIESTAVRGAYGQLIYGNVLAIQKVTGTDAPRAYAALEHASLSWKREPDDGKERTPEEAVKFMAERTLDHLGIKDDQRAGQLAEGMIQAWRNEKAAKRL